LGRAEPFERLLYLAPSINNFGEDIVSAKDFRSRLFHVTKDFNMIESLIRWVRDSFRMTLPEAGVTVFTGYGIPGWHEKLAS
jgi:hypothetical protein